MYDPFPHSWQGRCHHYTTHQIGVHTRFVQKLSLTYYTHNLPICIPFTSASPLASAL